MGWVGVATRSRWPRRTEPAGLGPPTRRGGASSDKRIVLPPPPLPSPVAPPPCRRAGPTVPSRSFSVWVAARPRRGEWRPLCRRFPCCGFTCSPCINTNGGTQRAVNVRINAQFRLLPSPFTTREKFAALISEEIANLFFFFRVWIFWNDKKGN